MKNEKSIKVDELEKALDSLLSELGYSDLTIRSYKNSLKKLASYMKDHNINAYTEQLGESWLASLGLESMYERTARQYKCAVHRFDDILYNRDFVKRHDTVNHQVVSEFEGVYSAYIQSRIKKGQREGTINLKSGYAACFFNNLKALGCNETDDITGEIVTKASIMNTATPYAKIVKDVLSFLVEVNLVEYDYSPLIRKNKIKQPIPSVYTKEERKKIESFPDTNTAIGKRDKAIILLATRNAFRPSDIVGLMMDEIDFDNNIIHRTQVKTGEKINPVLLDSVKEAILDYIANGRPDVDSDYVFITTSAPYTNLQRGVVHRTISKAIRETGVEINGRTHGGRAMRSSLDSSGINNGLSYEEVRIIDGHVSADSIKHYARLDDISLRKCALKVHPPTGYFARFLAGEEVLPPI